MVASRFSSLILYLSIVCLSPLALWLAFPTPDYYDDSDTVGLSTRRHSRVPCVMNVIGCRRQVTQHLTSVNDRMFSVATIQGIVVADTLTIRSIPVAHTPTSEMWVFRLPPFPRRSSSGFPQTRRESLVIDLHAIQPLP
jgi:hypothetical protein